jgi:hypothetical protein
MTTTTEYVFASATAQLSLGDELVPVRAGEVWPADDPVVTANPSMFSSTPPVVRRYRGGIVERVRPEVIESATARPGERRNTRRR